MPIDSRSFVFLAANGLLFYLAQLVNTHLAGPGLYLFLLGPMMVMPALYLRLRSAFICILFTGLWVDAAYPVPFGLFTCAFLCAGTLADLLRHRLRPEQSYHPYILAQLFNAGSVLLLTVTKGAGNYFVVELWTQTILTVLGSSICLLFVAPWFFQFQRMLIELLNLDPEPEDLPIR
jgi:rod shape-determining protein MreD